MTYDFYDLLEVPDDASQDEIKDAFRDKVQEVHPDLNDDPRAPAQFTALKKGYDTLKDPVERKAYDRLGHKDYVAKRLEGLPSADQWKPADSGGSASGGSKTSSRASTGSSSGAATGTSSDATSGGASARTTSTTGATGTGGATGTTGASTGTASGGAGSNSSGSTASASAGSATGTGGASSATGTRTRTGGTGSSSARTGTTSASATGTGSATDAATGTSTSDDSAGSTGEGSGFVERLRSINYGWPLVFLTTLVYAVGAGMYARENVDALQELVAQVRASGTDTAALREALLAADYGLPTVYEFVRSTALVGSAPGPGVLIAIGAVLMPAIFFVVVRTTRQAFAWQPTYLYVAAVLAPLAGLGANAGGVDRPALTVAAFGILPLGAVVALLFNAFVTPRLKRLF